tara:strand:+ start:714 stop:932 length:219 start_codon:yes stop_codon:yes gene_type:complete
MSCGLPHDSLDAAIASVKEVLKVAIENEEFPEAQLDSIWEVYQKLKSIKRSLGIAFVPDERFSDVIHFTPEL